jgi:hypothetical protein
MKKTNQINLVCKTILSGTLLTDFLFQDEKGNTLSETDAIVKGFTVDPRDSKAVIQLLTTYTGEIKKQLNPK